jgi:1,4-alpha-glucan branching enzyme
MFSTIVHINVKLKEAQNEGKHILNYDKYSRGAKDYYSLSREIITEDKTPAIMPMLEKKMKELIKERLPSLSEVVFSLSAPQAQEVYVTGDFNDWKLNDNSRMRPDNGNWTKRIKLTTGRYHYRFVIDGKWTEDPNSTAKELNPYGEMDSLVEVKD